MALEQGPLSWCSLMRGLAIAWAMANDASLVPAGGPTGNLDSEATNTIMDILARANQQGRTPLGLAHNPEVASNAIQVLRLREGTLSEVSRDPIEAASAGAKERQSP